jgi:hypothetical protein
MWNFPSFSLALAALSPRPGFATQERCQQTKKKNKHKANGLPKREIIAHSLETRTLRLPGLKQSQGSGISHAGNDLPLAADEQSVE